MASVTINTEELYPQLQGKNIIITGGSTGIGEAAVKILHGASPIHPIIN